MIFLLDVNVLIALIDKTHMHHKPVEEWFRHEGHSRWATCPITENGAIRVISNPRYDPPRPDAALVANLLMGLFTRGTHEFWPDDVRLVDSTIFAITGLASKDTTDTYLLGLAKSRGGRLATLDRRLSTRSVIGGADALHLIPT